MRVLHVGKYYPPFAGGIERFMADLASAQARVGHDVAVLAHHHERGQPTGENRVDGVQVCRVRCLGELLYAPISLTFGRQLGRLIRRFQPQILHLHVPNAAIFGALRSGPARALPWVVHWHSDVVASKIDRRLSLAYRAYRPFEQAVLRRAARIVATSQPYADSSPALAPWREKVDVVPLGADPARLPIPDAADLEWAEAEWKPGLFRGLTVGRLTYYKGHEVLLRALAGHDRMQLALVGSGALSGQLAGLAADLCLGERVRLLGHLPDHQVRALIASCDCFVLPSIERTEAFGVVLLEAMRYGKPLIASDIPGSGVGYVVEPGRNGLRVPVGDPRAVTEAMDRLRAEPQLGARLGHHGRKRFEQEFHIDRVCDMVSAIYRGLIPAPATKD